MQLLIMHYVQHITVFQWTWFFLYYIYFGDDANLTWLGAAILNLMLGLGCKRFLRYILIAIIVPSYPTGLLF